MERRKQSKLQELTASFSADLKECSNTSQSSSSLSSECIEVPRRAVVQSSTRTSLLVHFNQAHMSPILSDNSQQCIQGHVAVTSTPLLPPLHKQDHAPPCHTQDHAPPLHTQDHAPPLHTQDHNTHAAKNRYNVLKVSEERSARQSFRAMLRRAPPYERYRSQCVAQQRLPVCPLAQQCINASTPKYRVKTINNSNCPEDILQPK